MPLKTTQTLLLPTVALVLILVGVKTVADSFFSKNDLMEPKSAAFIKMDPCVAYNILQLICYAGMAIIIMRLKLFFTPQLCIVAGVIASSQVGASNGTKLEFRYLKGFIHPWVSSN